MRLSSGNIASSMPKVSQQSKDVLYDVKNIKIIKICNMPRYKSAVKCSEMKLNELPKLTEESTKRTSPVSIENRLFNNLFSFPCDNSKANIYDKTNPGDNSSLINLNMKKSYRVAETYKGKRRMASCGYISKPVLCKEDSKKELITLKPQGSAKRIDSITYYKKILNSMLEKHKSESHIETTALKLEPISMDQSPTAILTESKKKHIEPLRLRSYSKRRDLASKESSKDEGSPIAGVRFLPDNKKMVELRKDRLDHISDALYRAGKSSRSQMLKRYFRNLQNAVAKDKRKDIMIRRMETIEKHEEEIKRQKRRNNYGRWYLHPSSFGEYLKAFTSTKQQG